MNFVNANTRKPCCGHLAFVVDDLEGKHQQFSEAGWHPRKIVGFNHEGTLLTRFFFVQDTRSRSCNTVDNTNAIFRANLPDGFAHSKPDITLQNLEAILGRPDEVVPVIKNAMFASVILHNLILPSGRRGR